MMDRTFMQKFYRAYKTRDKVIQINKGNWINYFKIAKKIPIFFYKFYQLVFQIIKNVRKGSMWSTHTRFPNPWVRMMAAWGNMATLHGALKFDYLQNFWFLQFVCCVCEFEEVPLNLADKTNNKFKSEFYKFTCSFSLEILSCLKKSSSVPILYW